VAPLSFAGRSFAPSIGFTLLALLACAVFIRLGLWQYHKGLARQAQWTRFAQGTDQLVELGTRPLSDLPLFQRVSLAGTFDGAHQFLLDNRSYHGRAGYEVLTPLTRSSAETLIVDRGWVPFSGSRARLPDVSLASEASMTLNGRLAELPSGGLESGRAPPQAEGPWPRVTSYPRLGELALALGRPLDERILLLDPQSPLGYVRDWQPPGISPLRHFAYAIQWWCFAALALFIWARLSLRPKGAA